MYKIWFSFYEINDGEPFGDPCLIMFQGKTIKDLNYNIRNMRQYHDLTRFTPYRFVEILEEKNADD